jgi:hypothetical protein
MYIHSETCNSGHNWKTLSTHPYDKYMMHPYCHVVFIHGFMYIKKPIVNNIMEDSQVVANKTHG